MREIVNISMPRELRLEIKKEVKRGNFASQSEFIRHLIRTWKEERLFRDVEASRKEIKTGKISTLRSLKDLR